MRLCTCLTLALATAAALAYGSAPAGAYALTHGLSPAGAADLLPTCATSDSHNFPLRTHIHGGPAEYDAGGRYRTWSIDLTNTTTRPCANIYPVIVLVDEHRTLRPGQPRLEFYVGTRPHPVSFEPTDRDELVGVFDGFPGFTVAPGRTLTVPVRLAITSDAGVPNDVVAHAAVVQRHGEDGDDGDWVGESNDYRFRIIGGNASGDGDGGGGDGGGDGGDGDGGGGDGAGDGGGDGGDGESDGSDSGVREELPYTEELADTGVGGSPARTTLAVGLLLVVIGAILLSAVRRRR